MAGCGKEVADQSAMHLLTRSQGVATLLNAFRDQAFAEREVAFMHTWVHERLSEAKPTTI
jgi:TetR/AcrR family transcriptional repressor of nem operon